MAVTPKADKAADDDPDEAEAQHIAGQLDLDFLAAASTILGPIYEAQAKASAAQALNQVQAVVNVNGDIEALLDQADERAIAWAQDHAASIVGKKLIGGELVDNPDSKWVIDDASRDMLKDTIKKALEEGWSKDQLANAIQNDVFGEERADMIAQTELAFAHSASNRIGWKASGRVVGKYSILSSDHETPDECDDNAEAGVIPIDDLYPSGDEGYPFHVRCECAEVAVLDPDALLEAA